jgi:RimJ/RimL family protein N-acetyltransferase
MPPSDVPTLTTERLRLRAFREDDLDTWAAILADGEVGRFIGGPYRREDAWRSMAVYAGHWVFKGYGQWAVERLSDGALLGRTGLWNPPGWPELEVGWTFGREHWGHGYATEAGRASIEWAFEGPLGLARIGSVINPANAPSRAVAERLGMRVDREVALSDGEPVLVYVLER